MSLYDRLLDEMDRQIRDLERRAASGDPSAVEKLRRSRVQSGDRKPPPKGWHHREWVDYFDEHYVRPWLQKGAQTFLRQDRKKGALARIFNDDDVRLAKGFLQYVAQGDEENVIRALKRGNRQQQRVMTDALNYASMFHRNASFELPPLEKKQARYQRAARFKTDPDYKKKYWQKRRALKTVK